MSSFFDYRNSVRFVTSLDGSGALAMDKIHSGVPCNASDPNNCRFHKTGRFAQGKSNAFEPGQFDVGEVQDYLADLMTANGVDGEMDIKDHGDGRYQANLELKTAKMKDGMMKALEQFFRCKGVWTKENGYSIKDSMFANGDRNYIVNFRMPNSPKAIAKTDVEKKDAGAKESGKPSLKTSNKKTEGAHTTASQKTTGTAGAGATASQKTVAEKNNEKGDDKLSAKSSTEKKSEKTSPKTKPVKKATDIPYEGEGDTDGDDDAIAPAPSAKTKKTTEHASYKNDSDHLPDAYWENLFGGKLDDDDDDEGDGDTEKTTEEHKGFISPDKPKSIAEMAKADAKQQKADIAAAKMAGENTEAKIDPNATPHTKASENGGVFVCKSFDPAIVSKFESGFVDDQKGKFAKAGISSADYSVGKTSNLAESAEYDQAQKKFTSAASAVAASIKQMKQLALNGGTTGAMLDKAFETFNSRVAAYEATAKGLESAGHDLKEKTQAIIKNNGTPKYMVANNGALLSGTRSLLEKGSIFDKIKVNAIGGGNGVPSKQESGTSEGEQADNQPVVPVPDAPTQENKVTLNSEATTVQDHPKSESPKATALTKVPKSAETDLATSVLKSMHENAKSPELAASYEKAMKKLEGLIG